jgi:hypothetical protein
MEITINSLKYAEPNETVVEVNWGASIWETEGEETYSAAVSGVQAFARDESSPEFVSYNDLTKATVMQWLEDALDKDLAIKEVEAVEAIEAVEATYDDDGNVITEAVDAVEAVEAVTGVAGLVVLENKLAGFIAEQKNPVVEKGLPWENA